jgi:hypothetical protein
MSKLRVATLLHRRLGYDRLLNGEAPEIVYLDEEGGLFSAPVFDDAARTLRFKLVSTDMRGPTYSLLLHHCDFQFTASFTDGAIALSENASSARMTALCCRSFFATWRQRQKGDWSADPDPKLALAAAFQTDALAKGLVSASPLAQSTRRKAALAARSTAGRNCRFFTLRRRQQFARKAPAFPDGAAVA